MNELRLSAAELYYLAEYQGLDEIYGIDYLYNDLNAKIKLIEKGVLEEDGQINYLTVMMVELIKKYVEAQDYYCIEEFIFGVDEDGSCVAIQEIKNKQGSLYELLFGDVVLMLQIMMNHPLIRKSAYKHLLHTNQIKDLEPINVYESLLVIEHFKTGFKHVKDLRVWYKDQEYLLLDRYNGIIEKTEEIDCFKWLVDRLPQLKTYLTQLLQKMGQSNGQA